MIAYLLRRSFLIVTLLAISASTLKADDYALTPEQDARLRKYLPRTYEKLAKRNPVHVVTMGDSVMGMYGYGPEYNNSLLSYQSIFLSELSDQFYYPGGVRLVGASKNQAEKLQDILGLEITLQNLSRGGKLLLHALQPLTTQAFENKPDLVIVSYGINDATVNYSLDSYRRLLEQIVTMVKANNADLLLFGPTLIVDDPPEETLARNRPYTNIMRDVAEANGVWYCDLGDLSWLIKLDDRNAHLKDAIKEAAKKKEQQADAANTHADDSAQTQTSAPVAGPAPSPVVSPLMEQIDPDPDKKAAKLFSSVVQDYRTHFNHGSVIDWIHPDAEFHRFLGKRVYRELLNGKKTLPWSVSAPTLVMDGTKQCLLTYKLENTSETEQSITILPLVTRYWNPQAAPTQVILKPGKKSEVSITWIPRNENTFLEGMPAGSPQICFSIMHANAETVHIDDLTPIVEPVSVLWNTGAQFNLENNVELQARILNTSRQELKGKWEASLLDQKWSGDISVPVGESAVAKLPFNLPNGADARLRNNIHFTVTLDGQAYRFDRNVELTRNMGLKEDIALVPMENFGAGKDLNPKLPDASTRGVRFRADADANALYLTWDIFGINLVDPAGNLTAILADTNLDARSYGKRLGMGATDAFRIAGAAADGDLRVGSIQPWAFGTGYGMSFDSKKVQAKLVSRPDGSRRVTVALPRAYLYLHEWKIGNGNSQLGINTAFSVWQKDEDSPQGGGYESFVISAGAFQRDDAEALDVLELTDKPTRRWTLRLY